MKALALGCPPFIGMSKLHMFFFIVSLYWALASADYTIDDSNYSILKFSEHPAGPVWGPFGSDTGEVLEIRLPNGTMQTVDATQCYDGTYTYAACSASNNCQVQFSFSGSGITIYVLRAGPQGMSASLSIDSGAPTTATLDVPPPPQYYIPRVVLFSVQNIPSGTHTAVMTVEDWNGGFSGMMLDYIDINQAQVSGPTSSGPSPSPSPTPGSTPAQSPSSMPSSSNGQTTSQSMSSTGSQTSSIASSSSVSAPLIISSRTSDSTALPSSTQSGNGTGIIVSPSSASKKSKLAAVVGGAVGGAVGLLALVGLALFCFRRRNHQRVLALNERPSPLLPPQPEARFADVVGGDPFASSPLLPGSQSSRPLRSWTDSEVGSTPIFANNPSPTTNFSHTRGASSGSSGSSSVPVPLGVTAAATTGATPQDRDASTPTPTLALLAHPSGYPNEKAGPAPGSGQQQDQTDPPDDPGARPNTILTDQQADFVNSLFNNNVPAPVVARVLERMLANPQGTGAVGYNDPELRPHLNSANSSPPAQAQASSGDVAWRSTMSEIGEGETTIGTAPPSYDYAQAQ